MRSSPAQVMLSVSMSAVVFTAASFLAGPPLTAQDDIQDLQSLYQKQTEMIPMRDGIRMYTEIYTPTDVEGDLPIILLRTPYGVAAPDGEFSPYFANSFATLARDRYIFVAQDARGRFGSEGDFVWNRPVWHRWETDSVDASTDAYDAIEWLVNNIPNNNGRVGMLGVSYPGWYTTVALIDPHPALKAASPQASPSDYFHGDDFFHRGAFRLSPSAELPYLFDFDRAANSRFPYDQVDVYEFFLDLGPLSNMNEWYLHDVSPTWNNFMEHATYDEFWKRGNTLQHLTSNTVPTLNVVGWWDAENLGGALDIYDTLEDVDQTDTNWIVVGPWAHGQWSRPGQTSLGNYDFGEDTGQYYQEQIQAPWFAYYLKDEGRLELPEATMFQTGSNEWKTYDEWPPVSTTRETALYFREDGVLSFEPPPSGPAPPGNRPEGAQDPFDEYISDPANPVPYSERPVMGFWQGLQGSEVPRFQRAGRLWKVEDQRFATGRPDVLTWTTPPLEEDVEIAGDIIAHLFASTTGTDSDWVVKLIDVYPEDYADEPEMGGYQLMIADDVLRGKFRNGYENPEPMEPGHIYEFVVPLWARNHKFRQGHRIMVQVQSTWFPLIGRNPQTFTDIPTASEENYQAATQRVYRTARYPSHVKVWVAGRGGG